jgi:outer membrane protein OmpA-like peptidoglycan-associated protein
MAQHAFDDPMTGVRGAQRPASGGGWKRLFWFAIAAAGVGFAGYVYFIPYRQMASMLDTRSRELGEQRKAEETLTAERDRLKASAGKPEAADAPAAASAGKGADDTQGKGDIDALAAQVKGPLEALGATVGVESGRVTLSLTERAIDKNGIDVSSEGSAVLKILAGSVKKTDTKVRIKARFGTAPAPKQLRSLFSTVGEVSAVRAARVMSFLQGAGVAPDHLTIVGEVEKEKPKPPSSGKSKKQSGGGVERLDIAVEP